MKEVRTAIVRQNIKMVETRCSLFPENPAYCDAIVGVKRTIATISMIGSLFIVFIIWLFKKYKYFTQRLILFLSIAAFLNAVAMFMGVLHPKPGAQCIFQAWWLSFFDYALLLWVCCITFNLYRNAINKVRTEHFEKWYHLVSWGIPLVCSLLPFVGDHYGPAGAWCWIADNSEDVSLWRFMIWYVPLFICILAMFATYAYIFISYRKQAKSWGGTYSAEDERNKAMMKEHVRPLMAYPCIYLATSIFPLIHRIYNASTSTPSFPLLLLHVISTPLIGALNAVFFGIDKETLGRLNWPQMKVAFQQHSKTRKPLVREYPVGDTTETRPNDDSSWGSTGSSDARDTHAPPTLQPPTVHITGPTPPSSHRGSTNEITRDE
ncbi:G-protein coupled receptor 1 [Nematostella vectensis]|uniref:G-protein coupled receptor 1 n=1 Tax=Nematostella vectensis TaxID=45351 RepID=UPI00138FA3EC|nr:G-protein coupled receptor 1 [Nematostella vectensis]